MGKAHIEGTQLIMLLISALCAVATRSNAEILPSTQEIAGDVLSQAAAFEFSSSDKLALGRKLRDTAGAANIALYNLSL